MEFSEIGKGRGKSNNRKLQFFVFAAGNNEKTCKTFSSSCPVVFQGKLNFLLRKHGKKVIFLHLSSLSCILPLNMCTFYKIRQPRRRPVL